MILTCVRNVEKIHFDFVGDNCMKCFMPLDSVVLTLAFSLTISFWQHLVVSSVKNEEMSQNYDVTIINQFSFLFCIPFDRCITLPDGDISKSPSITDFTFYSLITQTTGKLMFSFQHTANRLNLVNIVSYRSQSVRVVM